MAVTGVLIWIASAVLAYLLTEVATVHCSRRAWDHAMREFTGICSALLGPIFLLISAELLLLSLMGEGLNRDTARRYRDS